MKLKDLKPGMRIAIRNVTWLGKKIIEGYATLVEPSKSLGEGWWSVRFDGELPTYLRCVKPDDVVSDEEPEKGE